MIHGRFTRFSLSILVALSMAACTSSNDWGGHKNPLLKQKYIAATEVPADFAIVVDESHHSFETRQTIQQVLTAADGISRNTYTTYRDYNNAVADSFSKESPLTASQLQAMWNEVSQNNLLSGSTIWVNWRADSDLYKKNAYRVQIRANGRTRTYETTNGFAGNLRHLMLLVTAVRLPISQEPGTAVVGAPAIGGPGEGVKKEDVATEVRPAERQTPQ
jgi:hypothetical protein